MSASWFYLTLGPAPYSYEGERDHRSEGSMTGGYEECTTKDVIMDIIAVKKRSSPKWWRYRYLVSNRVTCLHGSKKNWAVQDNKGGVV